MEDVHPRRRRRGTVTVLASVYDGTALWAAPLIPLICWARVRLSAHTVPEVVAGAIAGALIAGTLFPGLR